ncbi:MAG: LCP family protein [Clostridiales bacterium]|nr:LCP family protein [Clostridiales bacterium]
MKSNRNYLLKLVAALFVLAFSVSAFLTGIRLIERKLTQKEDDEILESVSINEIYKDDYITVDGVEYKPKKAVTSILLIGIDKSGEMKASNSFNNSEQCDFVSLLVLDENSKQFNIVQFNRDTMTKIPVIGVNDEGSGTLTGQLALAHTYGSGMSDSCRNVVKAVKNLIFDTNIDYYICANMSAVSKANDIIGGVTVKVLEDIPSAPKLKKDTTVKLNGDDALNYIRARQNTGDQTNLSRMKRQRQYMFAFVKKLNETIKKDQDIMLKLSASLADFTLTDCSVSEINRLSSSFNEYTINDIIVPKGESKKGEKYSEFYIDDSSLKKTVISLFYEKA